jgi:hypothetical protein
LPAGVQGTWAHRKSAQHAYQSDLCPPGLVAEPETPVKCRCLVHCCMQKALVLKPKGPH